ncbi:MAG: ATP-binding protein [Candidatus Orphnella occulta]|nr:ATP-binding protein [Candidatus Orphnella occulta]
MRKVSIDWKLAGGFSALLFLIVVIGAVGISQIQSLSKRVDAFGNYYFPLQKAALEMRINNSLYARGIRNYIFWRSARYLEAAKAGADQEAINAAQEEFDKRLADYTSFDKTIKGRESADIINALQQELRSIGGKIIAQVNQLDSVKTSAQKKRTEQSINSLVMVFESKLYRIDEFIEESFQKANLDSVEEQLFLAGIAKKRAIALLFWSLIVGLLIGGETAYLIYRNRKSERESREKLVHRMIRMEEEERQNLSLQVHNQMGQDLSALRIYLDIIDKKISDKAPSLTKEITQGKEILSRLLEKSHNIAELLRPPALQEVGIVDTISDLIIQYKQISAIKFYYQKPKSPLALSDEYSLILYRAAQEGLTNIIKHAQAKKVRICLEKKSDLVSLTVADDGVGFNYGHYMKPFRRRKEDKLRLGLAGLRERIALLGGKMNIDTAPEKGTKLSIELPFIT